MIIMIDLYNYCVQKVYEYVPGKKIPDGNSLTFRCPFCGDSKIAYKKGRGHLYKKDSSYHCFNCSTNYGAYMFLAQLQHKDLKDVKKDILYEYKDMGASNLLNQVFITDTTEDILPQVEVKREELKLKNSWVHISECPNAEEILENRLINDAPFLPRSWRLFYETEMKRIVIPWYRNGKLMYYQCRALNSKAGAKYLFPKDMKKDLFGADDLDADYPYVIYTEGVFDAIFIKNCLAVGGIRPTLGQIDLLQTYLMDSQLVLFPDNPWLDKTSKENIFKLAIENPDALVYSWSMKCPYKDVNEMVIANDDPKMFSDGEALKKRFLKASQIKIMLMFGKDQL